MVRKAALLRGLALERFKQVDKELHQIIPGIYLGSCGAAHNEKGLREAGVTHILCVAQNLLPSVKASTVSLQMNYLEIPIEDKPDRNITDMFDVCFEFIDRCIDSGGKVLIHCFQGKSRSASVVVGYLMFKKQLRLEESLALVKSKRPVVAPNLGFALQLRKYERQLATGFKHRKSNDVEVRANCVKEKSNQTR